MSLFWFNQVTGCDLPIFLNDYEKYSFSEKDNVQQMIMSVLGMEDESKQTPGNNFALSFSIFSLPKEHLYK